MNKKKTTRVLALISIMVLMAIISGCGTDEALLVYDDARAKMQKAVDIEYTVKADYSCPDADLGKKISGTFNIAPTVVFNGEELEAKALLDNQTIYINDGVEYVHIDEGKHRGKKLKLSFEEDKDIAAQMERFLAIDMARGIELNSEHIEKVDYSENKDFTSCKFIIKEEYVKEYLEKCLVEYTFTDDSATLLEFISTIKITDSDLTINADIDKEGYIKSESFKCNVKYNTNKKTSAEFEINASVKIKNVDAGIKIDFPNFKDYGDSWY